MGLSLLVLETSFTRIASFSHTAISSLPLKNKQVLPVQAQPWDFLGTKSMKSCKNSLWVKIFTEFHMLQVCEGALLCSLSFGGSLLFVGQRAA